MNPVESKKHFPVGTLLIAGLFLLVMLVTYVLTRQLLPPPELQGVLRSQYHQIEGFQLTGQHGELINETNFHGKWSFVFFGYTSCPDVCPATLHVLNSVRRLHSAMQDVKSEDIQAMFVSVDPERDTIGKLGDYVAYFNKDFIGATADARQIDKLTGQFGAGYLLEAEDAPGQYLVAHTSSIFLVDPLGRLVATFSQPHDAATIFSQYMKIKAYFSGIG